MSHPPSLPWRRAFICYLQINWVHSFWFGLICVATSPKLWHCLCLAILYPSLNLARSSLCCAGEIRKALPILLFYSHVSGGIREAFCFCTYYEVASNLPQGCVPLYYAILLFAYFVVLPFTWLHYIYLINGIVTLINIAHEGKSRIKRKQQNF